MSEWRVGVRARAECEDVPLGSGRNVQAFDIPSTMGSQVEADLEEAIDILREMIDPHLDPWKPSWLNRAKALVERLNDF